MAKYGVLVELVVEANGLNEATKKVGEVCEVFDSFSISEGPDEIEDENEDVPDEITEEEG